MFKNKLFMGAFVAGAILASSQSFAMDNKTNEGFYLGAGVVWSNADISTDGIKMNDAYGAKITAGYKFDINSNLFIAPEIFLSSAENKVERKSDSVKTGANTSLVSGVQGKFGMNIDKFSPYLIAGVGMVDYESAYGYQGDDDGHEYGALYGAGLEYAIADNVAMNFDYSRISVDIAGTDVDTNVVNLGASYYF